MAAVNVGGFYFFRNGKIDTIDLDTIVTEEHDLANTITQEAIEDGSRITDHIHNEPNRYVLDGVISKHPVHIQLLIQGRRRYESAWDKLQELHKSKRLFSITTTLGVISDLQFQSLRVIRNRETANQIRFLATLQKIPIVSSSLLASLASDVADALAPTSDLGDQ